MNMIPWKYYKKESAYRIINVQKNNNVEDLKDGSFLNEKQLKENINQLENEIQQLNEIRETQLIKIKDYEIIFEKIDSKVDSIFCMIIDKNNDQFSQFCLLKLEEKVNCIYNEMQSKKVINDYKISTKENNFNNRQATEVNNISKIKNKTLMVLNERCQNINSNYFKRAKSNAVHLSSNTNKCENSRNSASQIKYLNEIRQKLVGIDRALSKWKKEGFLKPYKSLKNDCKYD